MKTSDIQFYRLLVIENSITVLSSAICVAGVAIATNGSLHCFWGLLIMLNLKNAVWGK